MDLLSLLSTIIGMLIGAIVTYLIGKGTNKRVDSANSILTKLNESTNELKKISADIEKSISTRYIGNFPENINGVIRMIRETNSHLYILSDVASYATFSDHKKSRQYQEQILRCAKSSAIEFKLVSYDLKFYRKYFEFQFELNKGTKTDADKMKRLKVSFGESYDMFRTFNNYRKWEGKKREYYYFMQELKSINRQIIDTVMNTQKSTHIPLQWDEKNQAIQYTLWIRDEEEAIFSFLKDFKDQAGTTKTEVSFSTKDPIAVNYFIGKVKEFEEKFGKHNLDVPKLINYEEDGKTNI